MMRVGYFRLIPLEENDEHRGQQSAAISMNGPIYQPQFLINRQRFFTVRRLLEVYPPTTFLLM